MDEIFDTERPKGWRQNTHFKKSHIDLGGHTLPERIFRAVQAQSRAGAAIDKQLFANIAEQFPGVSAGTVESYYYEEKYRRQD
jgi:hypothetical protein